MPGAEDKKDQPGADEKEITQEKPAGQEAQEEVVTDDEEMSPEDMKKVIKDLRAENAKSRTKGKAQEAEFKKLGDQLGAIKKHLNIEDEKSPEVEIVSLKEANDNLVFELSMNQLAREHDIPVEHDEYFRFLMGKEIAKLQENGKEGDELSDEQLEKVIAETKKYAGYKSEKPNKNGSGIPDGEGKGKKPSKDGESGVTAEQYKKMTLAEKNAIYTKDSALYNKLESEARKL